MRFKRKVNTRAGQKEGTWAFKDHRKALRGFTAIRFPKFPQDRAQREPRHKGWFVMTR